MEKSKRFCILVLVCLVPLITCSIATAQITPSDPFVKITLLHINDLYEITPVAGGAQGGLARVATLRKQLLEQNPNTFMILAGDVLSPSALGTATVDGQRLAGKQMVAVLNEIGLNYCTFGNHEFDLKEPQFLQRLSESRFTWFSSNVFDASGKSFPGVAEHAVFTATNGSQQNTRIGLFGVTLDSNPQPYVTYADPIAAARQQVSVLKDQTDILIAVTHLAIEQDIKLAEAVPEIDLILGGHEHENVQVWRGASRRFGMTPIFKADANTRTVYVHDLVYNTATGQLQINSRLQPITNAIPEDSAAAKVVQKWVDAAFAGFRSAGFEPAKVVANVSVPLDGLESTVRHHSTALTELIAQSMLHAAPGAELAFFNGGSIRIDDVLPPGNVTEYDIIRILPFGGMIVSVEMKGSLLGRVLDQGVKNKGSGGFLHAANVTHSADQTSWLFNGKALEMDRYYRAATSDFLLTGLEKGLDFLKRDNPDLRNVSECLEVRKSLIAELKRAFP
jgi:5'-nucleotidase